MLKYFPVLRYALIVKFPFPQHTVFVSYYVDYKKTKPTNHAQNKGLMLKNANKQPEGCNVEFLNATA